MPMDDLTLDIDVRTTDADVCYSVKSQLRNTPAGANLGSHLIHNFR